MDNILARHHAAHGADKPSRLVQYLRAEATRLAPGSRLPTVRQLMRQFDASQAVVQEALGAVAREGMIVSQVGRGTFVQGVQPAVETRSVMILRGDYPSRRGDDITRAVQSELKGRGDRALVVTYSEMEHAIEAMEFMPPSDGYLLQPLSKPIPVSLLNFLLQRSPAVVALGSSLANVDVDSTEVDMIQSVNLAAEHLVGLGHQRIGLITGEPCADSDLCCRTFLTLSKWLGLAEDPSPLLVAPTDHGESPTRWSREVIQKAIADHGGKLPFTGLIARSYATAVGVMEALREAGLSVPGDVSLVTLDNPDIETLNPGWLSMVGVTATGYAHEVACLFDRRWNDRATEPISTYIAPRLVVGESTARAQPVTG